MESASDVRVKAVAALPIAAVMMASLSLLVPTAHRVSGQTPHGPILIVGDANFLPANGVVSGVGTWSSPYIIEGWDIDATSATGIEVRGTTASFIIRNVTVHSGRAALKDGILLSGVLNGRVENVTSYDNYGGIHLSSLCSNVTVSSSTVSGNSLGIYVDSCSDSQVLSNTVSDNSFGIYVTGSTNITVALNNMSNDGIFLFGTSIQHFDSHTIPSNNLVNNLPVYYYTGCFGLNVNREPMGQLIIANCVLVSISNLTIAGTEAGIEMAYVDEATVTNSVVSNSVYGVFLQSTSGVQIINNTIASSSGDAISIWSSQNTTIALNVLDSNWRGMYASASKNTSIIGNLVDNSTREGVALRGSTAATIARNTLSNNLYGIYLDATTGVTSYHNNVLNNAYPGWDNRGPENSWNIGYPSGGNHWSDYTGVDHLSGVNQDQPEADGIGDSYYEIDFDSIDRYPLMESYPDATPPIVSISNPTDGQYLTSSPTTVSGTAFDLGGLTNVEFRLNGGMWSNAVGKSSWTTGATLALGSNQIEARAWDRAGNPSPIASIQVFYDPTPPILSIVSPADGQWFSVNAVTVTGTANDALSGLDRVEVSCDGGATWIPAAGTISWTLDCVGLADGLNRIQAKSFDVAGWVSPTSSVTVNIDTTPPVLTIQAPVDGEWLNVVDITVSGTAAETGSGLDRVEVSCNDGATWNLASGATSWTYVCAGLPEGPNIIRARAFDAAGWESASKTIMVNVDLTPPDIQIVTPVDGQWVISAFADVTGWASDLGGVVLVEVSCNGGLTWTQATGTLTWNRICTLSGGTNTLKARAFDAVGWESSHATILVNYDPGKPTVGITLPTEGQWRNSSIVVLFGSAADSGGPGMSGLARVEVSCDGGVTWGTASGTSSWMYACIGMLDGARELRARSFDVAGSESVHASVSVQIDTVAPAIAISAPANNTMVRDAMVSVVGTASDDNILTGVKVRVGTGNWIDATGTMGWSAMVSLVPGQNTIEVQSHDRAGNPSLLATVTVFYDDEKPLVNIVCDNLIIDEGSTVRCAIFASDNQTTPSVSWSVTKGGQPVASGAGLNITFAASESGVYMVSAVATDRAGNSETATQTITSRLIISVETPTDLFWLMIIVLVIVAVVALVIAAFMRRQGRKRHEERHRDDLSSIERREKPGR